MPKFAYVNGKYGPIADAVVSIDDRGYQFGDGVYEVVYAFNGRPFLLEGHMRRLERSLGGLSILGVDLSGIEAVIRTLSEKAGVPRAKVYVSISRGVAPRNHAFPKDAAPSVVATVREVSPAPEEFLKNGIKAVTTPDIRWGRCDLKTLNLLGNVLARQEAEERGAQEAMLIAADGTVREGSSANVFIVQDGRVFTHPCDERILPGITRDLVLRLARQEGIPLVEDAVDLDFLRRADEIFLTGTVAELVAVTTLDDKTVGNGKPGPITGRLRKAYDKYIEEFLANT